MLFILIRSVLVWKKSTLSCAMLMFPGEVLKQVPCSGKEDVDNAVLSARKVLKTWSQKSGFERGQVLKRAADIIRVWYYNTFVVVITIVTETQTSLWFIITHFNVGLGGSVGCAVRLVVGATPAEVGNILSGRLIMKYFLWSFSPFCWFKKGSYQFLAKECAQYWLIA